MIAVTGATGLLGSFIVRQLVQANHPVIAIKREGSDTSGLQDIEALTWRDADVCDPVALHEALHDATTVIHAAAIVSFNPKDKRRLFECNVNGTRNVVDVCLTNSNIRRLVHISSVAAIGKPKDLLHLNENQKWVKNHLTSNYAESKYQAELEIMRGYEEGLSTVIVNPSLILSTGNWHRSSARIFKYIWDERSFYTDGLMNYVDVRDTARIVHQLIDAPVNGERFIVSAGTVAYPDLFQKIAHHFNKKAPTIKVGKKFIRLLTFFENIRSGILNTDPLITRETANNAGSKISFENKKLKNTLNFEFTPLEDTLQWCCEYYLKQVNGKK